MKYFIIEDDFFQIIERRITMNKLQVFQHKQFGEIRTLLINNEPWFVAKDVCNALELTNTTMAVNTLDLDERSKFNLGRQGNVNIVNEYGLYNLILSSRKKQAKAFKRWVTHDVLPAIRKTGSYQLHQPAPVSSSYYRPLKNLSGYFYENLLTYRLHKFILNV